MANQDTVSVVLTRDKETKNKWRFTSPQSGDVQGGIYVEKSNPLSQKSEITITVS